MQRIALNGIKHLQDKLQEVSMTLSRCTDSKTAVMTPQEQRMRIKAMRIKAM